MESNKKKTEKKEKKTMKKIKRKKLKWKNWTKIKFYTFPSAHFLRASRSRADKE